LYNFASLLVPVLGLGIHGAIIKFYPVFVQQRREEQFLSFTLILATGSAIVSVLILSVIFSLARSWLYLIFDNFALIEENVVYILVLGLLLLYTTIFIYHAMARYRIVIPDMINNVGIKIFLPVLILLTWSGHLAGKAFAPMILGFYSLVALVLLIYVLKLGVHSIRPGLRSVSSGEYQHVFSFMGFSILNALGASLALRIDMSMIGAMLSKESVGMYGFILTISNVMDIPNRAINQIASPVISSSWTNGNTQNIQDVYQKSSLYGLIAGVYLFIILFFIWPDVLQLMPRPLSLPLQTILQVFAFLGLARIIDLMTGVNSIIISYSRDYKYHMYFLLFLGLTNLVLNYFLLKKYGLPGVAFSTLIAYVLFNAIKHAFVRYRFGLQLHIRDHFFVFLAAAATFAVIYVLPVQWMPVLNMVIRSVMSTLIFGILIWWVNPGGEIRTLVQKYVHNFIGYQR
jgi:O-antigen/teichoic acid export membrane protein